MTAYDVFNGDADGLCALQQWRLADPSPSTLVTGVKRDIQLLRRVFPQPGDAVTVMDVSLDVNREDLVRILDSGAKVTYFDHHFSGSVPSHEGFRPHLSESRDVCTSLLVDGFLQGQYRLWAVVGAFGDNLDAVAERLAAPLLDPARIEALRELGRLLNYNGYGRTVEDLHFPPDQLHDRLRPYGNPFDFLAGGEVLRRLREGYASDMALAADLTPKVDGDRLRIYVLPDEAWSRRVSGTMGNELVRQRPDLAHAVLVPNTADCYLVTVRAPANRPQRADEFCRKFVTGGGRAAAAGINHLPRVRLDDFVRLFQESFS